LAIGTTTATDRLTVTGGDARVNGPNNVFFKLSGAAVNEKHIDFYHDTTLAFENFLNGSNDFIWRTRVGGLTERARIPSTGGFQSVNSISVGNATPTTSGAGITFPATQSVSSDANTLDDYEEGTWTPSVGGTATYYASGNTGTYTKIGRVVTFKGLLYILSIGTGSTTQITGFPFVIAVNGGAVCATPHYSGSATSIASANINMASSTLVVNSNVGNTTSNQTTNAFFQTGTYLEFSGTFEV